ncbi:ester cyclase [Streptomyces cellulosae]
MRICSRVRAAACSLSGPAGVLASSAWLRSAYGDLRLPIDAVAEDGDRVWVRMRGRHTGPFVRYRRGGWTRRCRPPAGRSTASRSMCSPCGRAGSWGTRRCGTT